MKFSDGEDVMKRQKTAEWLRNPASWACYTLSLLSVLLEHVCENRQALRKGIKINETQEGRKEREKIF